MILLMQAPELEGNNYVTIQLKGTLTFKMAAGHPPNYG